MENGRNSKKFEHPVLMIFLVMLVSLSLVQGCGEAEKPGLTVNPGATIYLSQAQFIQEEGDDGRMHSVPGPARLEIYSNSGKGWESEVLEDPESNVFHKAGWFTPVEGEGGILTIGATQAFLKIWRKEGGKWKSESLWNPTFGGKWDRLRDFEVADVTGDGADDIVIATHDQGVIAVASWGDGAYQVEELFRKDSTFVHEIEVGDVDGDGIIEFFTTPSKPNKLDGTIQPGEIDMFKYKDGEWIHRPVDILETRHAKEILCITLTGEDRPVLLGSLEGEAIGGEHEGDSTKIRMYRFEGDEITPTDITSLPGQLCRFLTHGDTDGDGVKELVASTKNDGIWKLKPPTGGTGKWQKTLIAKGTSGFEHATYLYDFSGDGMDELYVASDDQTELRRYWYNGTDYSVEVVSTLKDRVITFNVTAHQFTAAQ
jgi:hypothetical protein